MNVLGKTRGYPEAIARYAECKSLLGGVTTSQGIALFSNAGIRRYYKGLLRNVEISGGPDLPAARSEEHTSELQSLMRNSYAVFCLKKKKNLTTDQRTKTYHET